MFYVQASLVNLFQKRGDERVLLMRNVVIYFLTYAIF